MNSLDRKKVNRIYDTISQNGGMQSNKWQFYEKMKDSSFAKEVYNTLSNDGIKLLDAPDETSFLDSLGLRTKADLMKDATPEIVSGNNAVAKDSFTTPVNNDIATNITPTEIPSLEPPTKEQEVQSLKERVESNMQDIKSPKDSVLPQGGSRIVNAGPEKTADEVLMDYTPTERVIDEAHMIGEDKIADDMYADNLMADTEERLAQWHKDNDAFISEYESKMGSSILNATSAQNAYSESFSPFQYLFNKNNNKDKEFIDANSAKYNELIRQRDAIQRTKETVETMKTFTAFDRSVGVGEEMSSMVDKGELSAKDMETLRNISDEQEKVDALTDMYYGGRISEDTFNKILDLGDTSDKSGLWYGLFKTGKIEDFVTLGLNELARNIDIAEIASRYNKGLQINEDEFTLLNVYNKLAQIQSQDRSFGFKAGMGMQQSLQFVLESLATGGVNAIGSAAKQGGKSFLKRLGQNAVRQAVLTPITPMMYNDYAQRVTNLYLSEDEVSGGDKAAALWKSYVGTFAERFSETLGNVVGEAKLFNKLINNNVTRKLLGNAFETMAKIADSPTYKATAELLAAGGISDIPGEIASEYSGNIINSIFTLDAEGLSEIFDTEFLGQVALQSVMMGGMGNVVSFTVGSGAAALEMRKVNKEFKQGIKGLEEAKFENEALESLKGELITAINNGKFAGSDGTLNSGDISHILSQMKAEIANNGSEVDKEAMQKVDNAIRIGAFKYGQDMAIMAMVEDKVGEYLHDDGNVYEVSDTQGNNYFILAESGDAIVAIDRSNGDKRTFRKDYFQDGVRKTTKGSDWAMEQFLLNIDKWNAEDSVSTPPDGNAFTPADKLNIGGVMFDVVGFNPQTGKYTVVDENGKENEIDPNDEDVTPIYSQQPKQSGQTPPVEGEAPVEEPPIQGETPAPQPETPPVGETPVDGDNGQPVQEKYTPPTNENGNIKWGEIPDENIKEVLDATFPAEGRALRFIEMKISEAKKALTSQEKKKIPTDEVGFNQYEDDLDKAQKDVAKWENIKSIYTQPVATETPATTSGTAPVEQPAETPQETPPVVDDVRDNPVDARARGFRSVEGVRYDRQQPIATDNLGNEVDVKFAEGVSVKGKRGVIEADEAQPSHVGGMRNPKFFLDEAQPKDRTDKVSITRAERIAQNIRPDEITGGATAYTGSPVVNTRKEAIQGNGRLDALKKMYDLFPEQAAIYKQYLIDHAAEWGYDPNHIAAMDKPILVDVFDVTDEQAIQLGQRTSQDIESGGEQKISAQNVAQTLGSDIKSLANILLKTEDEDVDLNDIIAENGYEALKWLTAKKVITETQMQTALDEKGNITAEAREALKDVLSQVIFQGGNNNVRKQFKKLPKAAQKAILQTIARELDSTDGNGVLSDIQESIEVYSSLMNDPGFKQAKTEEDMMNAALSWAKQMQMDFTDGNFVPEDRYSNFAIALAVTFKSKTMKQQAAMLNQLYDYLQAEGGDIFNPAVKLSKAEAVKEVYNVELNTKKNETNEKGGSGLLEANDGESTAGGQGSSTDVGVPGQDKQNVEQTDNSRASGASDGGVSETEEADALNYSDYAINEDRISEYNESDAEAEAETAIKKEKKDSEADIKKRDARKSKDVRDNIERIKDVKTAGKSDLRLKNEPVTKKIQESRQRQDEFSFSTAFDFVKDQTDKSWRAWVNANTIWANQMYLTLKQAQAEAKVNNGYISDETYNAFKKIVNNCNSIKNLYEALRGKGEALPLNYINPESDLGRKGIEPGVVYNISTLIELYNGYQGLNGNIDRLAERVFKVAKKLNIGIIFSNDVKDKEGKIVAGLSTNKNSIIINSSLYEFFNDSERKRVLLHECIHAVTSYALREKDSGNLSSMAKKAVDELNEIYNTLKTNGKFIKEDGTEFYGGSNVLEMVAELSYPAFRNHLKKQNLFKRIIKAVAKFFFTSEDMANANTEEDIFVFENTTAFKEVEKGLITLLDSFDKTLYDKYNGISNNIEVSESLSTRPSGYSSNNIEMTDKDRLLYAIQDRMRPVKKVMDEIINRGGTIKDNSDPYSQEFLATSRAASEIEDFKNERYEPLADAIADAMKVFTEDMGMTAEDARKAVDDYLYARHAPERNKRICSNEIFEKGMKEIPMEKRHLVDDAFEAELKRMAEQLYDNQFRGGKNIVSPQGLTAEQAKVAIAAVGAMQKKTIEISKETMIDEQTGHKVLKGNNRSGMSDTEAEAIMNKVYTPATKAALDNVSVKVKDCTDFTLDKWLEYGLISRDEYNAYKNQYEYYIPLRGWEESEDIDYTQLPSNAFNVASEIVSLNRKAEGRTSKAKDPLAYIASLAQSACISGNRNLIRQKAFNMVAQNEGLISDLAVIENTYEIYYDQGNIIGYSKVVPSKALFDQGRVGIIRDKDYRWHKTPSQLKAHQVGVMIDGVRHVVTFKGSLGTLTASAINGTNNSTRNVVTEMTSKATRFISSNLTAKNVYFLGKNLMRDLGFGNFAYFVENGAGKSIKLNRYFVSAMRTAAMDAMGADKSTYKDADLYDEFKRNGGQTGYVQLESIDKLSKQMDKLINDAAKNRGKIAQEAVNAKDLLFDTFDVLGKASENAMRFAIYKLEREAGATERQAAIRAKEITVNFNRQGTKTKGFSSVYAFFNPAVQGTYRFAKLAKANPGRFAVATASLMAIKFGLGLICEMFSGSGDEPEGEKPYDRLSDYVKATNWVIPLGWLPGEGNNDKFLLIPMPQSVRGPVHASDLALDVMYGKKDFGEAVKDYAMFNVGEFLPFDIDAVDLASDNPVGTMLQAAMPTVLRPWVEEAINRDFMGNPIYKEPFTKNQDYLPQHQLAFKSTSPLLVGASKFLNEVAGGSEYRSAGKTSQNGQAGESWIGSFMDVNPASAEHILSGYFGGMFKPVLDVWDTMTSIADKDVETNISSVAVVNQFVKGPSSKPGYKKFYDMRDEVELINNIKAANKKEGLSNDVIDNNPYNQEILTLYKEASDIIKEANEAISIVEDKEMIKQIEDARDAIILQAATMYREICDRRDKANKEQ